jgi:DNA-binding transcriptional MocR family regulator
VQAVILTPRFQNPTGCAVDGTRAAGLREILDAHPGVLVIEDDHGGLIAGVPVWPVSPGRDRWAYVQSVSKSLGPDLRVALLTGDDGTVATVAARQSAGPGWVSHLLQRLVAEILDDPATPGTLQRAVDSYAERRTELIEAFAERGVSSTGRTGINVWIPVPEEEPVVAAMAGAGYAIRAGERWRLGTPPAVRVSVSALGRDRIGDVADIVAASIGAAGRRVTRSG